MKFYKWLILIWIFILGTVMVRAFPVFWTNSENLSSLQFEDFVFSGSQSGLPKMKSTTTDEFGIGIGDAITPRGQKDLFIVGRSTSTATTSAQGFRGLNLVSCDTIDTDARGEFICGSDASGAGTGSNWDYAWDGAIKPSTTVGIYVNASSTITANLRVDGLIISTVEIWVKDGTTIQSTIDSITDATTTKPYVVRIPPGVFTEQITMKNYVSLKGAGMYATKIVNQGTAENSYATIFPANQIVISDMSIEATGLGMCITNKGQIALQDDTFYVENVYLDCTYDLLQTDRPNVTIYVNNVVGVTAYDGFVIFDSGTSNKFYISNSIITLTNTSTNTYGIFRNIGSSAEMYIFNSRITGTISSNNNHIMYYSYGVMEIYNSSIDVDYSGTGYIYGIHADASDADIKVYGGNIQVTHSGNGISTDLVRSTGSLNVYGTAYSDSSGTIGGFGNDDGNLIINGNVGIGTSTPDYLLTVGDFAGGTGFAFDSLGNASTTATSTTRGLKVENLISCDTIDTTVEGHFICGSDASGAGGTGSNWQFSPDQTYIEPTTTVGIFVNANSTIAANFRVDGNATVTNHFEANSTLYVKDSKVGIGLSSPTSKLDIVQTGNNSGLSVYSNVGNTADEALMTFHVDNVAFDQNVVEIDSDITGEVGSALVIDHTGNDWGMTLVSSKKALFVQSTSFDGNTLEVNSGTTGAGIFVDKNKNGEAIEIDGDTNSDSDLIGLLVNVTNTGAGDAYAAIFETGNVGIGTASPTSTLYIAGDGNFEGALRVGGKLTVLGGTDPRYVSYTDENCDSIKQLRIEEETKDDVMFFWNSDNQRFEYYYAPEDTCKPFENQSLENKQVIEHKNGWQYLLSFGWILLIPLIFWKRNK